MVHHVLHTFRWLTDDISVANHHTHNFFYFTSSICCISSFCYRDMNIILIGRLIKSKFAQVGLLQFLMQEIKTQKEIIWFGNEISAAFGYVVVGMETSLCTFHWFSYSKNTKKYISLVWTLKEYIKSNKCIFLEKIC